MVSGTAALVVTEDAAYIQWDSANESYRVVNALIGAANRMGIMFDIEDRELWSSDGDIRTLHGFFLADVTANDEEDQVEERSRQALWV